MDTPGPSAIREVPPKSTLFCPECGHQSGVDGDWRLVQTRTVTRYLCPDCGTELTTRPRRTPVAKTATHPGEKAVAALESWGECVRVWQRLWLDVLPPYPTTRSCSSPEDTVTVR